VSTLPTQLLEVAGLRKFYPVTAEKRWRGVPASWLHAVDGVDLTIGHGETVGLVGESGCGKSTLVRLLARLIDPSAGSIRFDGADIGAIPARRFGRHKQRAQIQIVFQDATDSLNPRFTAFRAIADPLRRLRRLGGAALRARVEEVARLTGLPEELLGRFPHQLSGGQKARVGIARAIQVVILKLLDDLKQRLGLSYLFVSHDLNVVRLLCDRILVMYLGHIVESGPAAEIFAAPAHPYTKALLSAVPSIGVGATRERRIELPGDPRSPIDPDLNICPLYGRCFQATDDCTATMPALREIAPGRRAACHFPIVEETARTIPETRPVVVAAND
jgi:oligopeptide/dipeptide ABC transporter ATP-binding protein